MWLENLRAVSNVYVVATKDEKTPGRMTDYIDPYVTNMGLSIQGEENMTELAEKP